MGDAVGRALADDRLLRLEPSLRRREELLRRAGLTRHASRYVMTMRSTARKMAEQPQEAKHGRRFERLARRTG